MESSNSTWYPGRICLVGEHCDWAGGASLAVPLGRGIRITASLAPEGTRVSLGTTLDGSRISGDWLPAGYVDPDDGPIRFVPAALHLLAERGFEVPPCSLEVDGDLPSGRGFSSSAAFTLALLDSLTRLSGHPLEASRLAHMAFDVENALLGVECGLLDQLACAARAPVLIEWAERFPAGYDLRPVEPGSRFYLLVGAFPTPRDTRAILRALNQDRKSGGHATAAAFEVFADAARSASRALAAGDPPGLGAELDRAQAAYENYLEPKLPELAAPGLRAACLLLKREGATGAKFSGAGGDGSVVAVFEDPGAVTRACAELHAHLGISADYLALGAVSGG